MKEVSATILTRMSMICFWLVLLASFLFLPTLMRIFSRQKSITVFAWPMVIDAKVLAQFEHETGIHVYLSYYESHTELYSKLRATNGKGYDLVIPTHHLVPRLVKHGYLKKLDKSRLSFFPLLRPSLLNHYYDPENDYALPYFWSVIGLGVDTSKSAAGGKRIGWKDVFNRSLVPGKIGMTDDPQEAAFMAAQYLFGSVPDHLSDEQIEQVTSVLAAQKDFVELYSDARAGELLASHSSALSSGLSADIWRFKREYPYIDFKLPKEGGVILIDAMVLPAASTKEDLVYEFINFLYRPDILKHHVEKYAFCPPLSTLPIPHVMQSCVHSDELKRATLFRPIMPQSKLNDLWISVMAG